VSDPLDRLWDSFKRLVGVEIESTRYHGTYEYIITATDGVTVDAAPNDTTTGMPALNKVELRADAIATQTPTVGNICHVIFADGNPAKPKVTWCRPAPQSVAIDGGGPSVVRVGDTVNAGYLVLNGSPPGTVLAYFPGTTIGKAAANTAAAALTPPGTVIKMEAGEPTSGSSKVTCG
jgi:hypothetical protein